MSQHAANPHCLMRVAIPTMLSLGGCSMLERPPVAVEPRARVVDHASVASSHQPEDRPWETVGEKTGAMGFTPVDSAGADGARAVAFDPSAPYPNEQGQDQALDTGEQLAPQTSGGEGADFDPRLSVDGRWLVYASTQHSRNPDIYIKAVGGQTVTQLTTDPASDVMPVISPDGMRIAFASNRSGSWKIYVMSIEGGQPIQITSGTAHDLHPTWSPNSDRLAFCRLGEGSGRWELWVTEVNRPQVAEYLGLGMFPEWSPVSGTGTRGRDRILFQRGRDRGDRAFSLWTMDYKPGDAGTMTEVVPAGDGAAINGAWSPDGKWLTYSTTSAARAGGPESGVAMGRGTDLWIASIDGTSRGKLTGGGYVNSQPTWSADGRVYFVSNRGGRERVWSMAPDRALAAAGRDGAVGRAEGSMGENGPKVVHVSKEP